jgi:hypothetical protein
MTIVRVAGLLTLGSKWCECEYDVGFGRVGGVWSGIFVRGARVKACTQRVSGVFGGKYGAKVGGRRVGDGGR